MKSDALIYTFFGLVLGLAAMCAWATYWQNTDVQLWVVILASVAVGIAVDDTIHVYHGYISRKNAGVRPVQALARTFSQAGRAVVTTTIILSAQFMILISSLFQPTAHFGLLTSIGLWAALVFDLLLLPAIIILAATIKTGFSRKNSA